MNLVNEISLVVFDMAGTTVDENNVVYKTVQQSIANAGYDIPLEVVMRDGAGKEKLQAIRDVLSNNTEAKHIDALSTTIFQKFSESLKKAYAEMEVTTFEGVEELLEYLREIGVKIVLNTGYDSKTANNLLHKLGWSEGEHFDALITADDVSKGRPHPEMIHKGMELFGIEDSKQVLKAGDSYIDIEEGKNANCGVTIGVLTGAQTESQLKKANPTLILESLADLKEHFSLSS